MKRIQRVDLIDGPILPALLSFAFPILFIQYLSTTLQYLGCYDCGAFFRSKIFGPLGQPLLIFDLIVDLLSVLAMGWGLLSREIMGLKRRPIENQSPQQLLLVASSVSS